MKLKGYPLVVRFTHVNNENVKKTIARCTITYENIPYIIYDAFCDMFSNEGVTGDTYFSGFKIYAESNCKDGDKYDPVIGEKIARKKIMKKFMSMVKQAAQKRERELIDELTEVAKVRNFADDCNKKIIKYLKEQ